MPVAEYTPTVEELGRFLKARTRSRLGGAAAGTFDENTAITAEEAEGLIQEALDEVAPAIGTNMPLGPVDDPNFFKRGAKSLVLILSAMNVEMTLMPEQTSDPRSAYTALERRYIRFMKTMIDALNGEGDSAVDEGEVDGATEKQPSWSFPASSIGDGVMP